MLQVQVGIDVNEGEVAKLCTGLAIFLYGKLVDARTEVGRIILGEPGSGTAQFYAQHTGNHKLQIEVGEGVKRGQREHVLIG